MRALRLQRGITQSALAGADFTKAFISHIEHGRTRVSLRAAGILAARLGVDVRDLMAPNDRSELEQELTLALAETHLNRGDPAAALAALRKMQLTETRHKARARRLEGLAHFALGDARAAIDPLAESVRLFRAQRYADSAARATYDLAYAYASLDQPAQAVGLLLEAELALRTGDAVDRTLELKVHALLAGAFMRMGDVASADLHAERAAAIAEDVVDDRALDTLYASLMVLKRDQGDLEAALRYARKALQLHERAGRESDAVFAWDNLAWIYVERGQFERAEDALARAERVRGEHGGGHPGHLVVTRAKLDLARGRVSGALRTARDAAADERLTSASRAQAQLIVARALAAEKAPLEELRRAFAEAVRLHQGEAAHRRARVHETYAEALAARGKVQEAYREAAVALRLQRGNTGSL